MPHDHAPPAPPAPSSGHADPVEDFHALLSRAAPSDMDAAVRARQAFDRGGIVADLAVWFAAWRGDGPVKRPILALYASSYAFSKESAAFARERLEFLAQGGGSINRFGRRLGAGVDVFDLALDRPVADPAEAAPMTVREAAATMAFGLEAVAKQPDLLILCDLAPGSIHAGAALIAGLTNDTAKNVTGADEQGWTARALARARATAPKTPIEWMAQLGGREIAALAGAIVAARVSGVPVLVEGVAALAATLAVYRIDPTAIAHVRVAGAVNHPAHARALLAMGITPLTGLTLPGEEGAAGLAVLAMMRLASDD